MTRLAALTSTAVAAGLPLEQAEELARNLASAVPTAIADAAESALDHRLEQGWLERPECGVARLAERLADTWAAHDAEVERECQVQFERAEAAVALLMLPPADVMAVCHAQGLAAQAEKDHGVTKLRLAEVVATLRRLAAVIEYRAGFGCDGANADAREALTAAWEVLGPEAQAEERLTCAAAVPELPRGEL